MKIGIYSPYFAIMGGGELYLGTIAETLARDHQVDLVSETDVPLFEYQRLFGLDLGKTKIRRIPPIPFVESLHPLLFHRWHQYSRRTAFTSQYDLFVVMPRNFRIPFRILSNRKILHLQVPDRPWTGPDFILAVKSGRWSDARNEIVKKFWYPHRYSQFDSVLINSKFHQDVIASRLKNPNAIVLPPPVVLKKGVPWSQKQKWILGVGRFFEGLHGKRQDVLISTFAKLSQLEPGWKLILAGGLAQESSAQQYAEKLKSQAKELPVEFHFNLPLSELNELYAKSSFFWHASGFGAPSDAPERMEHFGISTVEAMSAGCIPMVYRAGGQIEIVQEGRTGTFWQSEDELVQRTREAIATGTALEPISAAAVQDSDRYGKERFVKTIQELVKKFQST
jgi:glycosyltransferase involved in cell wall biosynthesis